LFKFWWILMLALLRLILIGFCGTQNRACMLVAQFWWVHVCQINAVQHDFLFYFSLIHIYYQSSFLLLPLLCHASGFSWSYSHLNVFN
jgi:hypothetical protein